MARQSEQSVSFFSVELLIFVVAFAVAWLLRCTADRVKPKPEKKARKVVEDDGPLGAAPKVGQKPVYKRPQPQTLGTQLEASSLPLLTRGQVESILKLMHDSPGSRSASNALHIYADFRHSVGLSERGEGAINDAMAARFMSSMQQAKIRPLEFYSLLVNCAARSKRFDLLLSLLDDMDTLGVARTVSFYEDTMKQVASQKLHRLALNVYDRMRADGLQPSPTMLSCLLNFAFHVGLNQQAVDFFVELSAQSTPSIRAYMTIMRVYAAMQNWPRSLATMHDMQRRGVVVDSLLLNILLGTGVASEALDDVEAVVNEIEKASPESAQPKLDIVSYNTLMKGFAQRGDVDQAFGVLARIERSGLKPNLITFNTLMDACVKANRFSAAVEVFSRMPDQGLKPDKFSISIVTKGLTKNPSEENVIRCLRICDGLAANEDASFVTSLGNTALEVALNIPKPGFAEIVHGKIKRSGIPISDTVQRQLRKHSLV